MRTRPKNYRKYLKTVKSPRKIKSLRRQRIRAETVTEIYLQNRINKEIEAIKEYIQPKKEIKAPASSKTKPLASSK